MMSHLLVQSVFSLLEKHVYFLFPESDIFSQPALFKLIMQDFQRLLGHLGWLLKWSIQAYSLTILDLQNTVLIRSLYIWLTMLQVLLERVHYVLGLLFHQRLTRILVKYSCIEFRSILDFISLHLYTES